MAKTLFIFHKYLKYIKSALFIENYLHFMKNCIRPHYEKLKPLKSGFIENSNFENNRDPCSQLHLIMVDWVLFFYLNLCALHLILNAQCVFFFYYNRGRGFFSSQVVQSCSLISAPAFFVHTQMLASMPSLVNLACVLRSAASVMILRAPARTPSESGPGPAPTVPD